MQFYENNCYILQIFMNAHLFCNFFNNKLSVFIMQKS